MKSLELKKVEEEIPTQWDIKRITIGIVILAALGILGYIMLFPRKDDSDNEKGNKTLGIFSSRDQNKEAEDQQQLHLPTKEDVEKVVVDARNTLSQLTSENLTSSQAAIQKVIADLKNLQGKKAPVDIICDLVCKDK